MNVGDSSILELADGRLVQLSTDDALIGRASLPGLPSAVVIQTRGGGRALIEVVPHVHTDDGSGRRRLLLVHGRLDQLRRTTRHRRHPPVRRILNRLSPDS